MGYCPMLLEKEIVKRIRMGYLLYLPDGYGKDADKRWPLVLFLHGAGQRGTDPDAIKIWGLPHRIEAGEQFPFIAVSPQCPEASSWDRQLEALDALMEHMKMNYSIDEDRIYMTGLSMGGYGTWDYAMVHPELFAAIAPVAGGATYPELVGVLADMPIWAFHGAKDTAVPASESRMLVDMLKELGGNIRFTLYPDAGHEVCSLAYEEKELYEWLLSQSKKQ